MYLKKMYTEYTINSNKLNSVLDFIKQDFCVCILQALLDPFSS